MTNPTKRTSRLMRYHGNICELANIANEEGSTDVLGSYTGMGADFDPPEQDADDL